MNALRRKQINEVIEAINALNERIDEIMCFIEEIKSEEEECFENLPESFQDGERGEAMQEAIDKLESAYSFLEDIDLDDVISDLEDAQA